MSSTMPGVGGVFEEDTVAVEDSGDCTPRSGMYSYCIMTCAVPLAAVSNTGMISNM